MPNAAAILGLGLTTGGPYPYRIQVGPIDVTLKADLWSLSFQDNGDDEPGRFTARLWDATNTLVVPEVGVVSVYEDATDQQVWLGFVQRRWYEPAAVGRFINLEAVSISSFLDELLIVRESRPAESDRARVLYLWGKYAKAPLSPDPSFVKQTNASIAADDILSMTLRSALKFTMGLSGSTNRMAIDPVGRLHWFAGSETNPAPYNINRAMTPGGGSIAPDDIKVERDGTIKNRAYVRGANSAGSGWYQDDASVAAHGPHETFIDAPSADTAAKALSIARLYFGRVAQPRTRGTFTTEEPYNGWRSGQNVTITDPANDLSAQSFRLARVATTFTKGTGTKRYLIEFGGVRPRSSDVEDDILGRTLMPGQAVAGDTFDNDGNLLISGSTAGATGGFGPAVRRYVTSGIYNSDFALAPPYPESSIVEAWNPLPFWTFTQAGGTAITARSVADASSGSGRILTFDMAGGGIAGDDAYIEQLIPVNASRSQAFAYRARVAFLTGATVSSAQLYIATQYIKSDGITATGPAGLRAFATSFFGAGVITDQNSAANTAGQVPADAYYLRVRIGFKRDAAATSVAETLSVLEAHVIVGSSELMATDIGTPANSPIRGIFLDGVFYLGKIDADDNLSAPAIEMNVATGRKAVWGSQYIGSVDDTGAGYASIDSTNSTGALKIGDGVRSRPVTPLGFLTHAFPVGFSYIDAFTTGGTLPINGGSVAIPIWAPAAMLIDTYVYHNRDAAGAHTLEARLYFDKQNNSATATEVPSSSATWTFTPAAADDRSSTSLGGLLIGPGLYWLVIRNTSATVAAVVGRGGVPGGFGAFSVIQTKTLAVALTSPLDLSTGWTRAGRVWGAYLRGRVFAEAAGF